MARAFGPRRWRCACTTARTAGTTGRTPQRGWRWEGGAFRSAAFAAMCGQLPAATCILTGRCWEAVSTQFGGRPVLQAPVCYSEQRGPPYQPEPSTRSDRRPGELGSTDALVATLAVGPALARRLLKRRPLVDVPAMAYCAARKGHVLFIGEFTLANARHCAQYACERGPRCRRALVPEGVPMERRCFKDYASYTYADCLQHTRGKAAAKHAELAAGHLWYGGWSALPRSAQTGTRKRRQPPKRRKAPRGAALRVKSRSRVSCPRGS